MANKPYALIDIQTGRQVGSYANIRTAYRAADRKDQAYGAVRYIVKRVAA